MNTHITTIIMRRLPSAPLLLLAALGGACTSDSDDAALRITAYGEEYIEDRIPAEELVDGWEVDFSRFLVALRDVEANGELLPGAFVVDLAQGSGGEGHELGVLTLPAVDHPHLGYRVAPVDAATPVSATDDDVATLVDAGASIRVEGQATKDGQTLRFAWSFATDTHYVECHGAAALEEGDATSQLTIHADHLFYDDLDSEEPNVAFDLVASADADGDDEITAEELRALDITSQTRYQVGSRDITELWGFIEAQTATLGHIDGEGHCEIGS
ncbi:hypothetical protein [Paraliomyxa miuraensis]|uniref:hypothetical protein n=1 Tax=Paraliomyxa miuraensis TaxID=376150 RepID=UPI0022572DA0|nr:hypothetical protein [Paraliomyxa miuraensis]MCX4240008.1 hypothetical protein [Paraliomyxa miuraensis]